jgi:hypothetical protein
MRCWDVNEKRTQVSTVKPNTNRVGLALFRTEITPFHARRPNVKDS